MSVNAGPDFCSLICVFNVENRILIARIEEKTLDNNMGHSIVFLISIEIHSNDMFRVLGIHTFIVD